MRRTPGLKKGNQHSGQGLIMLYPVTTLSASVLFVLLVVLSARVIGTRRHGKVSLGDGGDERLLRRIRGQANLSEYAPAGLILMFLAESQGAWTWLVLATAIVFVTGRLLHGIAFGFSDNWTFGRFFGMLLTFTGIMVFALTNLAMFAIWLF